MQTVYNVQYARGLEGFAEQVHRSRRGLLPKLAQITTVTTANGAGSDDWVITFVDDETSQSYVLTVAGSATEATLASNAVAAFAVHDQLPLLFTAGFTSVSDVVGTFTAKHSNRTYTITATGGTGANTISITQAAGGSGINFGRFVRRDVSEADPASIEALDAAATLADLRGVVLRTDANSSRATETNDPTAEDLAPRGKDLELLTEGLFLAKVEEAVEPGDPVHLRRALTSGAGRLGGLRASPQGAAQVSTYTPTADMTTYSLEYGYLGQHYTLTYSPTDGTTSVADACDGIVAAANDDGPPTGVAITDSTTAVTFTTAAGTKLDYLRNTGTNLDADTVTGVAAEGAADADTIDISSIASFESAASADGLALVRVRM